VVKPNPKYVNLSELSVDSFAKNIKKLLLLEDRKDAIAKSINDEIDNLMGPGITEITLIQFIKPEQRKDIINIWLFHKEKRDSNGIFLKDKCRIVTLSQVRDTSAIGQTYSPTVNPISLFILLAEAATLPEYYIYKYIYILTMLKEHF
jgi:hypothetical protein